MPGSRSKIWRIPLYPWLLGIFPILHLYSANFGSVIDREVPICIFWIMVAASAGFAAINSVLRDRHQTAPIVAIIVLGFSLSGHIRLYLFEGEPDLSWSFAVLISMAIAIDGMRRFSAIVALEQAAFPLNLISTTLILLQVATLVARNSETYGDEMATAARIDEGASVETSARIQDFDQRPDIYYIIPDGYPSDAWLKSEMDFDNSAFTDALEARGFVVASHAQSNYASTLLSLASTLNMRHFNSNPTDMSDKAFLRMSIADNEAARFLKRHGYTYVQLLSGYLFPSPIADINRDFSPAGTVEVRMARGELAATLWDSASSANLDAGFRHFHQRSFLAAYFETTLLEILLQQWPNLLQGLHSWSYDMYSPYRFLDTIEELSTIVAMPEATFTLVHLLKPHRPVTFDADGNIISAIGNPSRKEHLAELEFVNSQFIALIDEILAGSQHQPIIVFQADHGSTNGSVQSLDERLIHFDVYSAVFIPDQFTVTVPRPFTTINTFPMILNAVFDAGFEFSDDRLFENLRSNHRQPFKQNDVTENFARWYD